MSDGSIYHSKSKSKSNGCLLNLFLIFILIMLGLFFIFRWYFNNQNAVYEKTYNTYSKLIQSTNEIYHEKFSNSFFTLINKSKSVDASNKNTKLFGNMMQLFKYTADQKITEAEIIEFADMVDKL